MDLSRAELVLIKQSLNEVLHGPNAIDALEFHTRTGADRSDAAALLDRLREVVDEVPGPPRTGRGCEAGRRVKVDASSVASRDDLADFLWAALADYGDGGGRVEWENSTLDRFLESLAAFAMAREVAGEDQETASWRQFAEMIAAATGYE